MRAVARDLIHIDAATRTKRAHLRHDRRRKSARDDFDRGHADKRSSGPNFPDSRLIRAKRAGVRALKPD